MPPSHRHYNGLKTAALFGAIWALLLGIGALVAGGRFLWIFALIGLHLFLIVRLVRTTSV